MVATEPLPARRVPGVIEGNGEGLPKAMHDRNDPGLPTETLTKPRQQGDRVRAIERIAANLLASVAELRVRVRLHGSEASEQLLLASIGLAIAGGGPRRRSPALRR